MSTTSESDMAAIEARTVANAHCACGENPIYSGGQLLWNDIPNGRIFAHDRRNGVLEKLHDGPEVGGFTLQGDGSILLFRDRNIARLTSDGAVQVLVDCSHLSTGRFNDVIARPDGGVFAGTMGRGDEPSGGLFRVERDGRIEQLWDGTHCSNGMAFTGDLRGFYWTDTSAATIWAFDHDRDTSELSNRRVFWKGEGGDQGVPDGLTNDCDGDLWVAFWGGACVRVIGADGQIKREIPMPTRNITSCVFGGPDMSTLYVTSAGGHDDDGEEILAGALFELPTTTSGRAEFASRIWMD